jgi:DNA-binding transcriptional MerR regulator
VNDNYSSLQVCAVAHVSYRQLDYWTREGLLPEHADPMPGSGRQRRYSRKDMDRVLAIALLVGAGFSLDSVRAFLGEPDAVTRRAKEALATAAILVG